jgi:outer membrane protein assembly factor BamB
MISFSEILIGAVYGTWPMWGGDLENSHLQMMKGAMASSPVVKWIYYPGASGVESYGAVIYDVDGDGKTEVVIGIDDDTLLCLDGATGAPKWKFFSDIGAGIGFRWGPAVADIDQDGDIEVIATTGGGPKLPVFCLSGLDGSVEWADTFSLGPGAHFTSPIVADVNGDGGLDVILASNAAVVLCLDSAGNLIWNRPLPRAVFVTPCIADVNSDGIKDIVVGSRDSTVYAIRGTDGAVIWSFRATSSIEVSSPATADLDGDGTLEVCIASYDGRLYCLSGANGASKWQYTSGNSHYAPVSLADLDGDGFPDAVSGSVGNGSAYCLKGTNGQPIWVYSGWRYVHRSLNIVDIDGDNVLDVLVPSATTNSLMCLRGNDGSLKWNVSLAKNDVHDPVVGDIDDDGCVEIVIGLSESNGAIVALDDPADTRDCGLLSEKEGPYDAGSVELRPARKGIYVFMPKDDRISLRLYDPQGRLVQDLYEGILGQGGHTFSPNLGSGRVYLVVLSHPGGTRTAKLVI